MAPLSVRHVGHRLNGRNNNINKFMKKNITIGVDKYGK